MPSGNGPGTSPGQGLQQPFRRSGRYDDSFLHERKRFTWPGGKTIAIWIAPNVEVWSCDSAAGAAIGPNAHGIVPDAMNYGWREYGMRVGLWRIADVLDEIGVKATVALNSMVCIEHPRAVDEMTRRGWEIMGHGVTNSELLANLPLDKERGVIRTVLSTIEKATGQRPRGWLGPALAETHDTLDILAEEGVAYCGDWNIDDQPYRIKVKTGQMAGIPYCMEINDIPLFLRHGYTGGAYLGALMDQFEQLLADSIKHPRVMGIPLHPMITGQPLRIKYLRRALAEMKKCDGVWFATGGEIVDAWVQANPEG